MKKFYVAAGVSAVLVGCALPQPPAPAPFVPTALSAEVDKQYVHLALKQARRELKDPESARFSSLYATKRADGKGGAVICGYVNAKNSYGGYTGKKPFMTTPAFASFWEESPKYGYSTDNEFIKVNCTLMDGERKVLIDGFED